MLIPETRFTSKQVKVSNYGLCSALRQGIIFLWLSMTAAWLVPSVISAQPAQLTILHTNSVAGHLFGCQT